MFFLGPRPRAASRSSVQRPPIALLYDYYYYYYVLLVLLQLPPLLLLLVLVLVLVLVLLPSALSATCLDNSWKACVHQ